MSFHFPHNLTLSEADPTHHSFGFAKFKDVRDSEKCIQGFYLLGYEVGFARESFNARLKAEGDNGSTNLYISNLPKSVTEAVSCSLWFPPTCTVLTLLTATCRHLFSLPDPLQQDPA